jgi:hypothetical protein
MRSLIYNSVSSVQQLLDRGFEMPIHFAAMGTNGTVVAGTYTPSVAGRGFSCKITIPASNPDGLTEPVNIMYVDRRGESAVVVVRQTKDGLPQPERGQLM